MDVEHSQRFLIPIFDVLDGEHEFTFQVSKPFFEQFKDSEIRDGDLTLEIILNKQGQNLGLDIRIKGTVNVCCDRCLEYFDLPVEYESGRVEVKSEVSGVEEDDDQVIYIPEKEKEIDLTQYVFESICLQVPYRHVHPDDEHGKSTCDPRMLEKIRQYSVNEEKIDSRWEELKKYLENNN